MSLSFVESLISAGKFSLNVPWIRNVGFTLEHHLRRWPNVKPTLFECLLCLQNTQPLTTWSPRTVSFVTSYISPDILTIDQRFLTAWPWFRSQDNTRL